jgi:hypothetical protein
MRFRSSSGELHLMYTLLGLGLIFARNCFSRWPEIMTELDDVYSAIVELLAIAVSAA